MLLQIYFVFILQSLVEFFFIFIMFVLQLFIMILGHLDLYFELLWLFNDLILYLVDVYFLTTWGSAPAEIIPHELRMSVSEIYCNIKPLFKMSGWCFLNLINADLHVFYTFQFEIWCIQKVCWVTAKICFQSEKEKCSKMLKCMY